MMVLTIFGIFMGILFILNYMFRLSELRSSDSTNAYLPAMCFLMAVSDKDTCHN